MAKTKRKLDSKAFAQQKRQRRRWVSFVRMCRYGINNFSRNAWLTVAATAVMTITLLIIFASVVARQTLVDTVDQLRDRVSMSIYLKNDTTADQVRTISEDIRALESVTDVSYTTPDVARQKFIEDNKNNPDTLEAVKEATNRFPGTLSIKVKNINETDELRNYVETNADIKSAIDPGRDPSFAGDRRSSIESIGRWANFAQQVGIGASLVFVTISMLIIFNTIRMAIFNRREEIQMMKLIGAERSFIRGPFLVEAIVYGFIAALIASGLGYLLLYLAAPALRSYQIHVEPTISFTTDYAVLVVLAMIVAGAIIGIVSSLFATRRYLKI
ncbi:hypothetical protein B7Y94_03365 [Candidatus Saccharibacteria bacterium 32-49-12]|nr:MAG: hypothetical protein B7Y94_03365 [Candidatus Saccharibacteria bacterium 32-49-12]